MSGVPEAVAALRGLVGDSPRRLVEAPFGAAWVDQPIDDDAIRGHLLGLDRIGAQPDPARALSGLIDFDGKASRIVGQGNYRPADPDRAFEQASAVVAALERAGGHALIERSRSEQGFHVIVVFDESNPPTLEEGRELAKALLRSCGLPDDGDE